MPRHGPCGHHAHNLGEKLKKNGGRESQWGEVLREGLPATSEPRLVHGKELTPKRAEVGALQTGRMPHAD